LQNALVQPKSENSLVFSGIQVPWYKLWYTVDLTVTHRAESEFRSEFITDDLLADQTIEVSETFFVFPWWLVIVLGGLIVIIWMLMAISRKTKKRRQHEKDLEEQLKSLQQNNK
jgi:hypothetical protein